MSSMNITLDTGLKLTLHTYNERHKRGFRLCPFHAERTPSFSVDLSTMTYQCFGCGRTGEVLETQREEPNA